jgi:VanZ family protein
VQLVAVYLPGTPDGGLEVPGLPGVDKLVHALIFAIPVYLLARLTRRVGLVAGVFALHAVVSELIQWQFIPYRDGDPWDAVADLIGIGLAVMVYRRNHTSWR